jgi:hypothetical protein
MICFKLVRIGRFTEARTNYLIVGYTKFQPDLLFVILLLGLNIFNHLYVYYYSKIFFTLFFLNFYKLQCIVIIIMIFFKISSFICSDFAVHIHKYTIVYLFWTNDIIDYTTIIQNLYSIKITRISDQYSILIQSQLNLYFTQ